MPTQGEITAVATIMGAALSFLGITGIDSNIIGQALNGVIAMFTIIMAVCTYFSHRNIVQQTQ